MKPKKKPAHRPRSKASTVFARWLDRTGYTYPQAAKILECSPQFVAHMRKGRYSPGRDLAARIAYVSDGAVPMSSWKAKS